MRSGGEMRVFGHKVDQFVFGTGIADVLGMLDENPCRGLPGMAGREGDAILWRDLQRIHAGGLQIFVERTDRRHADHITGPGDRKSGNRQAARQCLEQDQPERVSEAA